MTNNQDGKKVSEKVQKIVNAIKEKTAIEAYRITIVKDRKPNIFDSKFGGVPYWDHTKEYPKDGTGDKMMLLAQINFTKEALQDERLPLEGMLQFFIAHDDDEYGFAYDENGSQNYFRVVYHETIDPTVTKEQVMELDIPIATDEENEECSPVLCEVAVEVSKTKAYMGTEDKDFNHVFCEVIRELYGEEIGNNGFYDYFEDEEEDYVCEALSNEGHYLLGYPFFTQSDIREYMSAEETAYYDTVLFQMASEDSEEEVYVSWGDGGVGNFFINSDALRKKDFSKIEYNWDCY